MPQLPLTKGDIEGLETHELASNLRTLQEIEADKIYRTLFYQCAPSVIRERFIKASIQLHQKISTQELVLYYNVIKTVNDVEALEVACRWRKKMSLLTLKFRLMVFLAETLPENQRFFINERTNFTRCLWYTSLHLVRTMYKLCKGFYLLTRLPSCIQ